MPATVCGTPVVPVDAGPIDVGIAGIVVHRVLVPSVDVGDVWTPRPDHVGSARSNEDVVNMSISGNVEGRIVATPRFVAIHLRCEVEEEFLAECFGAICARHDRGIEASVDDLGEVDVVGFPIDERDASSGQIRFGDGAGPVVGPRVVGEVNRGVRPSFAVF